MEAQKTMAKYQKRIVASMLTFVMMLTGLYVVKPAGSVVHAAASEDLFAGYYTDDTFTVPSKTETQHVKKVSSDVLSVKLQVRKDSAGKYNMRVISSVDSLNYESVGFDVYFGGAAKNPTAENVISFETNKVLQRIQANETGVECKYSPKVIDTDSEYFVTGTIKGIHPKYVEIADSEEPFYIRPFWTTLDGTKVYGESRYFILQDGLSATNINMSVKADGISGDTVTVAVDGANVTANAVYTEDGYAHLNIPVANKTALKSATKVVVGGLTTYYRNLESSYNGTADTSWYTVCKEAGDTEFVLATDADLYGLGALSGLSSTIYMVADIEVNPDAPDTEGDWKSYITNNNPRMWTPIVGFSGTFDGQNHTIKGIYLLNNTEYEYAGLFYSVKKTGTIKNLRVTHGYYEATTNTYGIAAIAGQAGGTYKNIYTDVIIRSDSPYTGGIATYVITDAGVDTVFENCWNNSDITTSNWKAGGIVGNGGGRGFTIKNCLNTGDITGGNEYISGIIGGAGNNAKWSNYTIENCLNLGSITSFGVPTRAGAILGQDTLLTNASNLYYLDTNADRGVGQDTNNNESKVVAVSIDSLQGESAKTTLSGFDFDNVWTTTDGIPVLKGFEEYASDATPDGKVTLTITTAAQLKSFLESATSYGSGKKVRLGADIVLNDGDASTWAATPPTVQITPSGTLASPFLGTFDGQGYTISGLYVNSGSYAGLFAVTGNTAIVQNLKLRNGYVYSANIGAGSFAGAGAGIFRNLYTDLTVQSANSYIGGILGHNHPTSVNQAANKLIFESCWSDADIYPLSAADTAANAGGILGTGRFGFVISNCLFSGNIYNVNGCTAGGLLGGYYTGVSTSYFNTFAIEKSLSVGNVQNKEGHTSGYNGAVIGRNNDYDGITSISDNHYLIKSAEKAVGLLNGSKGYAAKHLDELTGEAAKETLQEFDFDSVWATVDGGVSVPASMRILASDVILDEKLILIENKADFDAFVAATASDNFFGKVVRLETDIVINSGKASEWAESKNQPSTSWAPIASNGIPFAGIFDGNGHTISGLYINTNTDFVGLFDEVDYTASIQNLKITNSYMKTTGYGLAPVVGKAAGSYKNIYTDCILEAGAMVGGIVGYNHPNTATQDKTHYRLLIENCWSNSDITTLSESTEVYGAGGILATGRFGFVIKNCLNTGNIYNALKKWSGGIVGNFYTGRSSEYGTDFAIVNCLNLGKIETETGTDTFAGAIMGSTYGNDRVTKYTLTQAENLYYLNTSATAAFGHDVESDAQVIRADEVSGENAKETLSGFDFTNIWTTVYGGMTALKPFAEYANAADREVVSQKQQYYVFYDVTTNTYVRDACTTLYKHFDDIGKIVPETRSALARDYEVWIGKADSACMTAYTQGIGVQDYRICVDGQKLIIVGGCDAALVNAVKHLKNTKDGLIRDLVESGYTYFYDGADTRAAYVSNPDAFLCNWDLEFDVPAWMTDYQEKQAAFADADGRMMSVFHRADTIYYPENSIESIISAIKMGADTVELDLCLTKDNVVVLLHTTDLLETTNLSELQGTVGLPSSTDARDWTYDQLLQLRLKSNGEVTEYIIPTFEEALQVCKGRTTIWLDKTDLWSWDDNVYPLIKKHQAWDTCFLPVTYSTATKQTIASKIKQDSGGVKPWSQMSWSPAGGVPSYNSSTTNVLKPMTFWYKELVSPEDLETYKSVLTQTKGQYRILAQVHGLVGGSETPVRWNLLYNSGVNYVLTDNGMALQQYIAENFTATAY